jgi:hypothetical protein
MINNTVNIDEFTQAVIRPVAMASAGLRRGEALILAASSNVELFHILKARA